MEDQSVSRLLDFDPVRKSRTLFHYDASDDTMVHHYEQDVTDVVEYNKARYNLFDERTRWAADGDLVASIPNVVWFDLVKRGIAFDNDALKRWLDDPDNRAFRVRPGRLS